MSAHAVSIGPAGYATSRWCRRIAAGGLCVLLATVCQAQTRPARAVRASTLAPAAQTIPQPGEAIWLAASDRTLDKMRGGFDLGAGLMVSFGISRAVYINGQLITSTTFQIGDLASLTPPQAAALSQQISTQTQAQVVKNGPGNTVEVNVGTVPLATYIQNTVNNQTIRSQTIIDATSNGMGIVKGLNLQATIDEAIAKAIGTR
jgi:hypothetical protein